MIDGFDFYNLFIYHLAVFKELKNESIIQLFIKTC